MKKLLLLAACCVAAQYAVAQAALEITLLDSLNMPVAFQQVLLSNPQIGLERETLSNEKGKARFEGLSTSGSYSVLVPEGSFYQAQSRENVSLISNKTHSIVLILTDKVLSLEAVTVSAGSYQGINSIDAEVASELTRREIAELPLEGRDITRALYRLPNITQATGFFPEAPNVAINGANSLYTNYQIDGLDNNENFLGGQR
ncbi:MAG: hypothetical protein KDC43_01665, partial [Saprospiraceae bacterium]|nr:hypothetical protein [Saprospiraceae bacterium]